MPKADKQATDARKFVESKSHVTKDGREVLYKLDWKRRVKELEVRCCGQCENKIVVFEDDDSETIVRCIRPAEHPHHIVLRSRKRDDRLAALLAVCASCHRILDARQRQERVKR